MKYTKSFRYDSEESPEVHQWILNLEKEGRDFSKSVRLLISGQPSDLMTEIENIKKQLAVLAEKGVRIEPVYQSLEEPEEAATVEPEKEPVKVNVNFIKQRYF
jgi:hypothetical protein